MKTNISQRVRGLWLQGAAAAAIATGLAAFAPVAHAQTGTLYLGTTQNCPFNGFTWDGSKLTVTCTSAQQAPSCDATQAGSFGWAAASASVTPGGTATGQITRTGGCKGQYTITFGTDASAYPGVTLSPATSVSFADGSATPQTVTVGTTGSTPVGTKVSVYLNGFSSSTNSPAPPIGGTFVASVAAAQATPPPATSGPTISYTGALQNNVQVVWGTNESNSLAPFKPTDIASYSFTYGGQYGQIVFGAVSNNVYGGVADTEFAISSTPGDFPGNSNCDVRMSYSAAQGSGTAAIYVWTPTHTTGPYCLLTPGNTYYLNMRQVSSNWSSNAASCPTSPQPNPQGCALRMQPSGVN